MKKIIFYYLSLYLIFTAFTLKADHNEIMHSLSLTPSERKEMMLHNLDYFRNLFKDYYAPSPWKKRTFGWDIDNTISFAKSRVCCKENITIKDYQNILKDIFNSTRDYHSSVLFHSTEGARLPISIASANGRYFITYINSTFINDLHLEVGDEVITFGNRPIDEVVQQIKKEELGNDGTITGYSNDLTDQRLAEKKLTLRVQTKLPIPNGDIDLGIRSKGTNYMQNVTLTWDYNPELIKEPSLKLSTGTGIFPENPLLDKILNNINRPEILIKLHNIDSDASQYNDNPFQSNGRLSYLPTFGSIRCHTSPEDSFHAYIYKNTDGRNIGCIRIPHYCPGKSQMAINAAEEYFAVINKMEQETDAIIIDQLNNCGGYDLFCYALASMFSQNEIHIPMQHFAITQKDIMKAYEVLNEIADITSTEEAQLLLKKDTLFGFPVDYYFIKNLRNNRQFLIDEWNSGRTLTNLTYNCTSSHFPPSPFARYTKPVLLLINEFDFSCGDIFPAIMQDNGLATILGTRTSGAGGCVRKCSLPNSLGISAFTYTQSFIHRKNGNVLENLGVTPDIEYSLSENDLQYGFQEYAAFIRNAIDSMLPRSSS